MRQRLGRVVQRRTAVLGVLAVLFVTGLAGTGYALTRALAPNAGHRAASAPAIGLQPVAQTHPDFLSVTSSDPAPSATGVPADKKVTLDFNLPVDPAALQTYLSVRPDIRGSFAAGATDREVVWTPDQNFAAGISVSIVIRQGFASRDGFTLNGDFNLGFQTAAPATGVMFQAAGQVARLINAQSGRTIKVTLQYGNQVPGTLAVQTYRVTAADLLRSLVHSGQGELSDSSVGTSGLKAVDSRDGVKSGDSLSIAQPDGIYAVVAGSGTTQYGVLWVDFSRDGILLRQDDQKVVVAGEDLVTGDTTVSFGVTLYNLQDGVHVLRSGTFSGTGELPAHYPSAIDVAVATADGEEVVVPVSVPESNADLKLVGDLSREPQLFLTTDRAAYQKGETIRFAGIARFSDDQAYTAGAGMKVTVTAGAPALAQQAVEVAADGTFQGSLPMPDAAFSADGSPASLAIFAAAGWSSYIAPVFTVVQAVPAGAGSGRLTVTFDKASYLAGDTVTATITGTGANGQALANQALSIGLYSARHKVHPSELDNFPQPTFWGAAVQTGIHAQLDGGGHATYSFPANVAKNVADQDVTLTAITGGGQLGARTALVYQAADEVFLLPSRSVYKVGEATRLPFVVETHDGTRAPGVALTWELDRTDYQGSSATMTAVVSGAVTADGSGLGAVTAKVPNDPQWLTLKLRGRDAAGNAFEDARQINITADPGTLSFFGTTDALRQLDVSTDKLAYSPGDNAHLTVHSAAAVNVLMSLERGRIHHYEWVKLAAGDNSVSLKVPPDLAPGFSVLFSYFADGAYVNEGLPIAVNNRGRLLKVTLTPTPRAASAAATSPPTVHVLIAVTDSSGAPVSATLLVDGYDAAISAGRPVDQPSLARAFLEPAVRGTNGSSSLVGLGMGGGRCGGGESPPQLAAAYPGRLALWQPSVATDASGHAALDLPMGSSGPVRLTVMASTTSALWGEAQVDVGAS